MRFRTVFAAPAAIAAALTLPAIAPESLGLKATAQAQTSVSFSIGVFYDDLAPYGSWVNYSNAYVFVPEVGPDWRPYTVGHWTYTDRYGWLWVSDEPFGWATAHYGRWGFAEDIGWYWVPGRRWAPAWVSWKRTDDYVAWAPLPPDTDDDVDVSIDVNINAIPAVYWNVVPARRFLEPNIRTVVIRDDRERFRIVERARPIGHVTIQNNVIVNNVINVRYIERATRRNVRPIRVREVDNPRQAGRRQGDAIAIFRREAEVVRDRRPRQVRDVAEIRRLRAERRAQRANQRQDGEQNLPGETTGTVTAPGADVETGTAQQRRQRRDNQRQTGEQGDQTVAPDEATDATTRPNRQRRQEATPAEERPADRAQQRRRNNAGDNRQNVRERRNVEQPAERVQRRRQNNQTEQGAASRRNRQEQPAERVQRRRPNAEQGAESRRNRREQPTERVRRRPNVEQGAESRRNRREQPAERVQRRRPNVEQGATQQTRRRANQEQPAAERRRRQEPQQVRERARQAPAERQQRRRGNQACDPATQNCP